MGELPLIRDGVEEGSGNEEEEEEEKEEKEWKSKHETRG